MDLVARRERGERAVIRDASPKMELLGPVVKLQSSAGGGAISIGRSPRIRAKSSPSYPRFTSIARTAETTIVANCPLPERLPRRNCGLGPACLSRNTPGSVNDDKTNNARALNHSRWGRVSTRETVRRRARSFNHSVKKFSRGASGSSVSVVVSEDFKIFLAIRPWQPARYR